MMKIGNCFVPSMINSKLKITDFLRFNFSESGENDFQVVVGCDGIELADEEDVFRLEVGVRQLVVVHELDRVAQLVGNVTDLL